MRAHDAGLNSTASLSERYSGRPWTSVMNAFMAFLAPSKNARHVLTNEQRQMYAAEKLENFRWISKLVASYSPYVLSKADFAPGGVTEEIAELGKLPWHCGLLLNLRRPVCRVGIHNTSS